MATAGSADQAREAAALRQRLNRAAKTHGNGVAGSSKPVPSASEWGAWESHLATRSTPIALKSLVAAKTCSPLLWSLLAEISGTESEQLLYLLDGVKSRGKSATSQLAAAAESWLEAMHQRRPSPGWGLEALAWCHALTDLAPVLAPAVWNEILGQLLKITGEAARMDLATEALAQQLLAGELPLTLAYLFPEIEACQQLGETAGVTISEGLTELLDGEGLPHGKYLSMARPLFASWTRCQCLGRAMRTRCFSDEAQLQYEWLVLQMLRLCRNDGTQVLAAPSADAWTPSLFEVALTLVGDTDDLEIAACILPGRKAPAEPRVSLPSPATNSEWAELAVLRREWKQSSDQLAVSYGNGKLLWELNCGSETVFSGVSQPELSIDGVLLPTRHNWDEVCWQSDHDVDYLELEIRFESGWKVQRQMLLVRDDRVLFIADAVLGERSGRIQYRNTLPLTSSIAYSPADETHEGVLTGRKKIGLVLPLQLPEWRAERVDGALVQSEEGLELRQSAHGQRLFAPVFIDLDAKRFSRQVTWRRLTVAQRLEIAPADVAVGYRVQTGNRQWLIYRSLGPKSARSVLGQNFSSEFVFGRFPAGGEVEKLLEIE